MIILRHIEKTYERKILHDVNLTFQQGNIYILKGVSGSGKTSLLQIIGCIDKQFEGEYVFDGINVLDSNKKQEAMIRKQIGYMNQESLLIQELTVYENLRLFHTDKKDILKLLENVGLHEKVYHYPSQLSNGERQRVSLIRALLKGGKVIICDEPTASLDEDTSMHIVSLLSSLKELGYCIIIATHEDCFDDISNVIIKLKDGHYEIDTYAVQKIESQIQTKNECNKFMKEDFRYAYSRNKKKRRVFTTIMTIFFCILFLACSCILHFKESYMDKMKKEYPYTTFTVTKEYLEKKMHNISQTKLIRYDKYELIEDDVCYTTYTPYEDSTLRIPDAIVYGKFPDTVDEVLINTMYAKRLAQDNDMTSLIGQVITVANSSKKYIIAGIVGNNTSIAYDKTPYYENAVYMATVFGAYEEMKQFLPKVDSDQIFFSVHDENTLGMIEEKGLLESWNSIINERFSTVEFISSMIILVSCIVCFIAFLFLYQVIDLELFYRRKEIGFLQLFGMDKKRIRRILYVHYIIQTCIPLFVATFLYYGGAIWMAAHGIYIMLRYYEVLIIYGIVFIYVCILLSMPIYKLLRLDIKQLIFENS